MSHFIPPRNPQAPTSAFVRALRPDNFTAAKRTPWGGRRIVDVLKAPLGVKRAGQVGESWEVSVSELPSVTREGTPLPSLLASAPAHWLGEAEAPLGATRLLVKLLDAAEPLSVQIHPSDDDPALAPDEGGKPEAWYVLHAEQGAGIYLGLREGVDRAAMAGCLDEGGDASALLRFVPVEPGDFFTIDPGTPHAIGAGLTLLEPQRVTPGRRGVTYRYWDWNRRYDADGRPSPEGSPRPLHRDRALEVTDWDRDWGRWLQGARNRLGAPTPTAPAELTPIVEDTLGAARWTGTGEGSLPALARLRGVTVVEGELTLDGVRLRGGESAVVAAAAPDLPARLEGAHALVCWIP